MLCLLWVLNSTPFFLLDEIPPLYVCPGIYTPVQTGKADSSCIADGRAAPGRRAAGSY